MSSFRSEDKNRSAESLQVFDSHRTAMSGPTSFDGITIAFHWATVLFVLGLLVTALLHGQLHDDYAKMLALRIHRSLGVAAWFITVFRIAWRVSAAQMPPFPTTMTARHRALVQISEYALYALLVIQPVTGLTATITRGRGFDLFWSHIPPLTGHYPAMQAAFLTAHRLGAWTLIVLITGHALVALVRHFILRDDVLLRMAPLGTIQRRARNFALEANEPRASFEA